MIKLKNYMEQVVERVLDKTIKDMNICKCERCKADIMAIALNTLPGKYVVTSAGESYIKLNLLENQFEIDVVTAIAKASDIVGKNPRHGVWF